MTISAGNDEPQYKYDRKALYFLCWLDAIERLDTLLLEARHLQQNIIYVLRAPVLYQPLRYEEGMLWDKDGWKYLTDNTIESDALANRLVLRYPSFRAFCENSEKVKPLNESEEGLEEDIKQSNKVIENIEETLKDLVGGGIWNTDQRAHYLNLRAVQDLKRHIVYDKIVLCREGLRLFTSPRQQPESRFSRFLILRSAILSKARTYISRLGDHLSAFAHSQDYGLSDHPRPVVQRRRDQHMYNTYLKDHCFNVAVQMSLLISEMSGGEKADMPLVFHRWEQDFSSHSYTFKHELGEALYNAADGLDLQPDDTKNTADQDKNKTPYQHYINTSYWMPERPDLQSVIAHEVAHTVLREKYSDLLAQALDRRRDSFSLLLKQLNQHMDEYQLLGKTDAHSPLREVGVDLLAAAVQGPAYLYALFLELIGFGAEDMFAVGESPDPIELRMIDHLDSAAGDFGQIRDWYFRLHMVCTWLEVIFGFRGKNDPRYVLAMRLVAATASITDDLLEFYDRIAPPNRRTSAYWRELKDTLCQVIQNSSAAIETRDWLGKRERDDWERCASETWEKGERNFPRADRKLHWKIRN
ncbi:MAG: hypothetical protein ACRERU_23980, partial [Methylococcales bacterium]